MSYVSRDINSFPKATFQHKGEIEDFTIGNESFPLTVQSTGKVKNIVELVNKHKSLLIQLLHQHGSILFRNFEIDTAQKLRKFAKSISNNILDYVDRAAPRIEMTRKVYSSTEFPSHLWISLHHEMSYTSTWPLYLYFACLTPAADGGYTTVADDRMVYKKIPSTIKKIFESKGLLYVRNYAPGLDMTWQEAFQTNSKLQVETILRNSGIRFEWISNNHLRTKLEKPAVLSHPISKEPVWFNHAHLFHKSNIPIEIYDELTMMLSDDELPRNVYFADGTDIEVDVLDEIRTLYKEHTVYFNWEKGDLLLLDNISTVHGRSPYKGDRKICVAMSDSQSLRDIYP